MTNSVHQKPKTSVELFQSGDDKTLRLLTRKLETLLGDESPRFKFSDEYQQYQHLTLQEFQENFEWEESYSVSTEWNLDISYETELECEDKEECLSYINGDLVMEEPDIYELQKNSSSEVFVNGYEHIPVVDVTNLRLKSQIMI